MCHKHCDVWSCKICGQTTVSGNRLSIRTLEALFSRKLPDFCCCALCVMTFAVLAVRTWSTQWFTWHLSSVDTLVHGRASLGNPSLRHFALNLWIDNYELHPTVWARGCGNLQILFLAVHGSTFPQQLSAAFLLVITMFTMWTELSSVVGRETFVY